MDSSLVDISLCTTSPALLKKLCLDIPKGVRTVNKGWTWEEVFREEYGVTFDKISSRFIHLAKFGKFDKKNPKNELKDKVSKLIGQFKHKTHATNRVYSVRLLISRHIPNQTTSRQLVSELTNNVQRQQLECTRSHSPESPAVIEMDCPSDEEEELRPFRKKEEVSRNGNDDFDEEDLLPFQNNDQEDCQTLEDDNNEVAQRPSRAETERMFNIPMIQNPAQILPTTSKVHDNSIKENPEVVVTYAETIGRSAACVTKASTNRNYSAPTPYLKRLERQKQAGHLQDDNESVFTTATQDVLLDDDLERVNRFRKMLNNWSDCMVLKMYEELSKLSDSTWQHWLARAPNTTGVLRQSFKIA